MSDIRSEDGRAVWVDGHWEIEPSLVGTHIPLPRQEMNLAERQRIIQQRLDYLDHMHDHFADGTVDPPEGIEVVKPGIEVEH